MKIIDISQEIYQGMPVYPGDPTFQSHRVNSFKQGDMCEVSEVTMGTHCGTHIDAPTHMVPDGKPLESFPLDCFIGPCRVLNVPYPRKGASGAECSAGRAHPAAHRPEWKIQQTRAL